MASPAADLIVLDTLGKLYAQGQSPRPLLRHYCKGQKP
jgi:hypothetical protein